MEQELMATLEGTQSETNTMMAFAATAKEEGFPIVIALFTAIAKAEKQHAKQYQDFIANLKSGQVFKSDDTVVWYCSKCGYVHEANEPPENAQPVPTQKAILNCLRKTGNSHADHFTRQLRYDYPNHIE